MSIIQELYNIYDREQSKYLERKSSQRLVVLELSGNLAFVREGLAEKLAPAAIVAGLSDGRYHNATERGVDLNAIQKKALARSTFDGMKEFDRYQGWSTEKLINNAYERIATLRKLNTDRGNVDLEARLKYLFKYLMVVMAHIKGERITIGQG